MCRIPGCTRDIVYRQAGVCRTHYMQEWRGQRKRTLADHLGGRCVRCGWTPLLPSEYAVFDFHHLGGKDEAVANLINAPWGQLTAEAAKCELLCANCHRLEHAARDVDGKG
jgi:hypothetical protein